MARPVPSVVTDPAMYRSVLAITVCRVSSNRGSAASMSGVYLINGVDIGPPLFREVSGALRSRHPLTMLHDVAGLLTPRIRSREAWAARVRECSRNRLSTPEEFP